MNMSLRWGVRGNFSLTCFFVIFSINFNKFGKFQIISDKNEDKYAVLEEIMTIPIRNSGDI